MREVLYALVLLVAGNVGRDVELGGRNVRGRVVLVLTSGGVEFGGEVVGGQSSAYSAEAKVVVKREGEVL